MMNEAAPPLYGFWRIAAAARDLAKGRMKRLKVMGEPVLLARAGGGRAFALRDVCPHRGIPLGYGGLEGDSVRCSYHGWRFGPDGRCREIPSLTPEQDIAPERISCGAYPVREVQGNLWIFVTRDAKPVDEAALPPVPRAEGFGDDHRPGVAFSSHFPCSEDHAVYGLMDPTHAAFVHTSRWWSRDPGKLNVKERDFEPTELGWRWVPHTIASYKLAYRLIGDEVTSDIDYALPGLRRENISGARGRVCVMTAITPNGAGESTVHQRLYWTMGWGRVIAPVVDRLSRVFLEQDRRVVIRQQEGLPHAGRLMLIPDADAQAVWWSKLKRAWVEAEAEGRAFVNPLKAETLRWRS